MAEVRCPLSEAALISKHQPALVCEDRTMLFHDLDEMVSLVAVQIRAAGGVPGTRVALFLSHDWRYVVLLLGIIRAGCVACPVNSRWPRAAVLDALRRIDCRTIIARADASDPAALSHLKVLDPENMLTRHADTPMLEWKQHMRLNEPAVIVFTSGSTGEAKAAALTYGNLYYSARASNLNIRLRSGDRWLLSLPLYHVGGLGIVFRCVLSGATLAVPEPGEESGAAALRLKATHLSLVSTQLFRLLREDESRSFGQVRAVLLGGGPISPRLIEEAQRGKIPVFTSYGLTEMASQVTTTSPEMPPAKKLGAGKPLRHQQVRVAGDGEIQVRGDTLFAGYVENGGLVRPLTADGWFATGDLGRLDEDGCLVVLGRKDNMFISGGENIHPEEIERAILDCAGVSDCCVVPVPDEEFGQRPVAFVRGLLELEDALEKVLPRFKVPIAFLDWPEAVVAGGKPDRVALSLLARVTLHR